MSLRRATHAGSWYTSDGRQLRAELDNWLRKADQERNSPIFKNYS
jgi:predicted class III extradiol MEMO1 family dioxygenase